MKNLNKAKDRREFLRIYITPPTYPITQVHARVLAHTYTHTTLTISVNDRNHGGWWREELSSRFGF